MGARSGWFGQMDLNGRWSCEPLAPSCETIRAMRCRCLTWAGELLASRSVNRLCTWRSGASCERRRGPKRSWLAASCHTVTTAIARQPHSTTLRTTPSPLSLRQLLALDCLILVVASLAMILSRDRLVTTYEQLTNGGTYSEVQIRPGSEASQSLIADRATVSGVRVFVLRTSLSERCALLVAVVPADGRGRATESAGNVHPSLPARMRCHSGHCRWR